jgi:uncharacterized glyoxalase superfamily protein PhnB
MRKNNLPSLVLFTLLVGTSILLYILYSNNVELTSQINRRDKLLVDSKHTDSLFAKETKRYSDTITKYISDCQFEIEGKTINQADLVKFVNVTLRENTAFQDSIYTLKRTVTMLKDVIDKYNKLSTACITEKNKLQDTAHVYSSMYKIIRDRYGIEYKIESNGKEVIYINEGFSKADSGLVLLPYFRQTLKREGNVWIITH